MKKTILGLNTLMTEKAVGRRGTSLFNNSCTNVHLRPLKKLAPKTNKNPTMLKSTLSPQTVKNSPKLMIITTRINLHDTFSNPNKNAQMSTKMGVEAFTIV
mmetsp:Transcript_21041/g.24213  ORF Transcript_21041/g.24213 Transcript_21041/m.24213 type:complete len:101 (-) Transcript_21041:517-819(-)